MYPSDIAIAWLNLVRFTWSYQLFMIHAHFILFFPPQPQERDADVMRQKQQAAAAKKDAAAAAGQASGGGGGKK